eukprot:TRINITY_DN3699_c0_g1_i1.p1 TRINITY_DN3699_c0_g1~~TRINITY_DN3699_c0_g1_i1.p1  ORF type:complete len:219 (-),score=63.20 TRINITY_DN3699_c0_g1_i1:371-1027(-)
MAPTLLHVDITSDTVCPWCFVGKRNIDEAIAAVRDKFEVQTEWHPYLLNPDAPVEGRDKKQYYHEKFGVARTLNMTENMAKMFKERGLDFKMGGKTGSTLDSHRLLVLAGKQSLQKQNELVEELFKNYFAEEKYIGDRKVLLEAASKVGVEGAEEWLADKSSGVKEVNEALALVAHHNIRGVPFFVIGIPGGDHGKVSVSGAQPAEVFIKAFEKAASL